MGAQGASELCTLIEARVAESNHVNGDGCYCPWDRTLVPELEKRVEAVTGTFNAQDVANTLWAYATMGREPFEMLRRLPGATRSAAQ
jgi:hypothetical protein